MLMEFPALPEAEEICGTIPTDVRRRFRVNRDRHSMGRGAVPCPGADGKGGDLALSSLRTVPVNIPWKIHL